MMMKEQTTGTDKTIASTKPRLPCYCGIALFLAGIASVSCAAPSLTYELPPIPEISASLAEDSVPMAESGSFQEVKLDIPVAPGPFEPTWESIEKNYPGEPAWLREAKFGIWVHFGPQAVGESGDWHARRLYSPGTTANINHLKRYAPTSKPCCLPGSWLGMAGCTLKQTLCRITLYRLEFENGI
jgi:hypothetical protein